MFDFEENRGVVDGTVAVVIVADRAVEQMIAEDAIKCLTLRCPRPRRCGLDMGAVNGIGSTGPHELAVHLDHAGIAGLDGTKLGVKADLGNQDSAAVDGLDQALPGLELLGLAVYDNRQGSTPFIDCRMLVCTTCGRKALFCIGSQRLLTFCKIGPPAGEM